MIYFSDNAGILEYTWTNIRSGIQHALNDKNSKNTTIYWQDSLKDDQTDAKLI